MDFDKVKTYVCPVPAHALQIEGIKGKITASGGILVCDDKVDLSDFQACVDGCAVVVILICPETEAQAYVDVITYATQTGKQVIGVWPEGKASGAIPVAINSQGDGAVTFDDLGNAGTAGERGWQLPDAKVREKQKTPRHKG